jgi:hypothetical protein
MRNTRLRFVVATVAMTFVLAIAFGAFGAVSNAQVFGASTSLTVLSGEVMVRHGAGDFVAANDGDVLNEGDTVRTGTDARAILTYFEGSTVTVEPDTQLTIENSATLADGSTVVVMSQAFGRTWHVVTKLITGSSKYDVKTPANTASVRGTAFEVTSDQNTTTVTTTEGTVLSNTVDPDDGRRVNVPVAAGTTLTQPKNEAATFARPAAAPERKVTVTVDATNSLVVDPLGRANGITRSGRVVLQTPGAQVKRVDGKIVVTLPNLPDGALATRVEKRNEIDDDDVDVEAKLEDRDGNVVDLKDKARSDGSAKTLGVEFKKNSGKSEGHALPDVATQALASPRTGSAVQVLDGPYGTKRLVTPAVTEAPTKKDDKDKKDAPRPVPTPRVPVPTSAPTKRG